MSAHSGAVNDEILHRLQRFFDGQAVRNDVRLRPDMDDVQDGGPRIREAAVLIPLLRQSPGEESRILLTLRTQSLRSHAGQVALPGGTCDPGDCDPIATALRESHEEIGLTPSAVNVIGQLSPVILPSGYRVTPVVGLIEPDIQLRPSPAEVAAIFHAPASLVLNPDRYNKLSMVYRNRSREVLELYYQEYRIWGATASILHGLGKELNKLST